MIYKKRKMLGTVARIFGLALALYLALTWLGTNALAGDTWFSFGPSLNGTTNPKLAQVGYEFTFGQGALDASCGTMFESSINGYCSIVVGERVETTSGGIYPSGYWASCYVPHR